MPTINKAKARSQSRERMRRYRQRRAAQNLAEVRGIVLPPSLLSKVQIAALFTNTGSVTELVSKATQIYIEKTADDTTALLRTICIYWPKIRQYRPYLARLASPCPPIVIKGVPYTHEQATKFIQIYSDIRRHMRAFGFTLDDAHFDSLLTRVCVYAAEHKLFVQTGLRPQPVSTKSAPLA